MKPLLFKKKYLSRNDWNPVADQINCLTIDNGLFFVEKDSPIDPAYFAPYLLENNPKTIRPGRARLTQEVSTPWGAFYVKRFHYHRTYRKKQRWFSGYRWQQAHGLSQFCRALYASNRGHNLPRPVLAGRRAHRLRQESLLVIPRVHGDNLKIIYRDPQTSLPNKLALYRRAVEAISSMHQDRISFGDTKIRHLIQSGTQLYFIDFDKLLTRTRNILRRVADFRRLTVTTTDQLKQFYAQFDWNEELWPCLEERSGLSGVGKKLLRFQLSRRL